MNDKISRNKKALSLHRLSSGGVITNYYCSSQCGHCLYSSSPRWEKKYLEPGLAREIFGTIRRMGCRSVHIGGGEPFLNFGGLKDVLRAAQAEGVDIEYVETNSSWYKDSGQAREMLLQLPGLGAGTLLISISPFHNEHIPFAKVKGVMDVCADAGVDVFPWVQGFSADIDSFPDDVPHKMAEYEERFGGDYLRKIPNRYWVHLGGRAFKTFGKVFKQRDVDTYIHTINGCIELEEVSHFHFDLYGNFVPALCSGISIDYRDLGKGLEEEKYPFITLLYNKGPAALYRVAVEEYGFEPQAKYISKCHLCHDIRRFLVIEKGVGTNEFGPRQFYLE